MYSLDEVKEFISVLEESSLSVLEIQKEDGSKIHLEKPQQIVNTIPVANGAAVPAVPVMPSAAAPEASVQDSGKTINAPIVGVVYAAPSPESEP